MAPDIMNYYDRVQEEDTLELPDSNFKDEDTVGFIKGKKRYKDSFIVGKDKILLGLTHKNYGHPVTWNYTPKKRMTIVIAGGQGSGKTVHAGSLVFDQLHGRFGHPVFAIDPKLDTHKIAYPNTTKKYINILMSLGLKPTAYNAKYTVPEFMDLDDSWGKRDHNEINFSFHSLEGIDKDTKCSIMAQIFGLEKGESGLDLLEEIILKENAPKTCNDFQIEMEMMLESPEYRQSKRIIRLFRKLTQTKKISDKYFNYSKEMVAHGVLVLEGSVADEDTAEIMTQGVFVNVGCYNITNERRRTNNDPKIGILHKIPVIFMDEANTYASRNGLSAGIMTALSTKYREIRGKAGVTSVILTQFLHELAPKIVSEADLILTPKIINKNDIEILKNRGCDPYVLESLYWTDSPSNRPNQWCAWGKNGLKDYKLYYPIPTTYSMPIS